MPNLSYITETRKFVIENINMRHLVSDSNVEMFIKHTTLPKTNSMFTTYCCLFTQSVHTLISLSVFVILNGVCVAVEIWKFMSRIHLH